MNSDHRLVVGRAITITGPYVDSDGVAMMVGGGGQVADVAATATGSCS